MSEQGATPRRLVLKFDQLEAELAAVEEARDAVGGPDLEISAGGNLELGIQEARATSDAVGLAWLLVERERRRVETRRDRVVRAMEAMEWIEWRVVNPSRRLVRRALS